MRYTLLMCATAMCGLLFESGAVMAGDASVAWGTAGFGGTSSRLTSSATLHKLEGENAQIVEIGRDITSMYRSVTACGTCVYYSIDGDNNEISDNSASGINSGDINASGSFD